MNTHRAPASLSGRHRRTYESIFRHPIAHNLPWRDVHALFRHLGELVQEPNDNLRMTRHRHTLVLPPPRTKDVAHPDEVMALRHFLQRSDPLPAAAAVRGSSGDWLLVIDHREARIFRSDLPGTPAQQILPPPPEAFFRHPHNSMDFSRGKEKPDPGAFFEPVAQALRGAGRILVFGCGKGMGSAMEQFLAWLRQRHAELARHVIRSMVVDEHHLSDAQLLAQAREHFRHAPVPGDART